jgi:hypothetical protein
MTTSSDDPAPVGQPAPQSLGRTLAALLSSVGCAGILLVAVRWHSPENFFAFNSPSVPWSYLWSLGIVALALFAVTAYLVRGLLAAAAWFAAALLALSVVGLVEGFWFALQVLQGESATDVLARARGYAVTAAVALVLLWAATALLRRPQRRPLRGPLRRPNPASDGSDEPGRLAG